MTATANDVAGRYTVTATAAGAGSAAFDLTNTRSLGLEATAPSTPTPTSSTHPPSGSAPSQRRADIVVVGLTSLREAIAYANSHPGPDTIIFDPAVFGRRHRTIKLIGGPLILTDPATTTIIGPGARSLTIRGGGRGPVFEVRGGSLALSGLTIRGGHARHARGGGLRNDRGTVSLAHVAIRGNSAARRRGDVQRRHGDPDRRDHRRQPRPGRRRIGQPRYDDAERGQDARQHGPRRQRPVQRPMESTSMMLMWVFMSVSLLCPKSVPVRHRLVLWS